MKNSRYTKNFVLGEKYTKGYYSFLLDSGNLWGLLFCIALWWGSFLVETYRKDPDAEFFHFFSVFVAIMLVKNYREWREQQQGKSS